LKGFQSKEDWRLPFWNTFFSFRDIHDFVSFKFGSNDVTGGSSRTAQHSIENNSRNIKAVRVLQSWHQQCTSQQKLNDTHRAVATPIVMPLVLF